MKLLHAFVMGLGCFDSIVVEWTNITTQHHYIKSLSEKSCTNFFLKLLISFVIFNLRLWGYFFAKGQKNLRTMLYELNNISDGYSVVLKLCTICIFDMNPIIFLQTLFQGGLLAQGLVGKEMTFENLRQRLMLSKEWCPKMMILQSTVKILSSSKIGVTVSNLHASPRSPDILCIFKCKKTKS